MNMMRRVIAKRMSDSYFSAPTFVLNYEVDMYEATKLRKQLLEPIKEKTGKKLTVTDIISIAVVRTLMNHPISMRPSRPTAPRSSYTTT